MFWDKFDELGNTDNKSLGISKFIMRKDLENPWQCRAAKAAQK